MTRLPRGIALFFAVYFLQGMVFYSPVGRIKKEGRLCGPPSFLRSRCGVEVLLQFPARLALAVGGEQKPPRMVVDLHMLPDPSHAVLHDCALPSVSYGYSIGERMSHKTDYSCTSRRNCTQASGCWT